MSAFFRSTILATCLSVMATAASFAQMPKPKTPGEMAAVDKFRTEKTAACRARAKEQKIALMKRRAFVKDCVAH